MRITEALIIALLIAALYLVVRDDQGQRVAAVKAASDAVAQAHKTDSDAASHAQAQCADQINAALKAGVAIARLSAPRVRSDPKVQPMIMAAAISEAIQ